MFATASIWKKAAVIAAATMLHLGALANANAQQEPPKVSEQIQRLIRIASGEWVGKATLTLGEQTLDFQLTMSNKATSGGWGLLSTVRGTIPGMGPYNETDLFGYDAGRDQLHLFSVTCFGETHDHSGRWTSSTQMEFRYEGVMDGQPMVEEITAEFATPRELRISSSVSVGGKPASLFKVVLKKKS